MWGKPVAERRRAEAGSEAVAEAAAEPYTNAYGPDEGRERSMLDRPTPCGGGLTYLFTDVSHEAPGNTMSHLTAAGSRPLAQRCFIF